MIVTARYPYQPSTIGDPASAAVDYTVHSEFQKTLQVLPKGGDRDTAYTRIVLAHAQDIDGSPLEHETVCWTSNDLGDGAITAFPSGPGGDIFASYDAQGIGVGDPIASIDPEWAHDPDNSFVNAGRYCTTTDENGNTAIEFSESKATTVDVVANWVNEALTRDTGEIPFGVQSLGALTDSGPVSHIPSPALVKAAAAASASGALSVGPVLADGSAVKAKVIKSAKVKKPRPCTRSAWPASTRRSTASAPCRSSSTASRAWSPCASPSRPARRRTSTRASSSPTRRSRSRTSRFR